MQIYPFLNLIIINLWKIRVIPWLLFNFYTTSEMPGTG